MDKKGKRFSDSNEIIQFPLSEEKHSEKTETNQNNENKVKEKTDAQQKRDEKLREKNARKLEKQLKKQRKKKKYAPKPEIPDDEEPIIKRDSDNSEKKHRINKKQVIAAVVIVAVLFGIVFFAANPERFTFESISNFVNYGILKKDSEEKFPLNIQGVNITSGNFVRKGQDICFTSDTGTNQLNSYGKTVYSTQHAFIDPILCSSAKKDLVYNLGSTGFQIISEKKVEYTADAKDNILVADINEKGIYAIVTESSGYLSKLYVYDEENTQIYAYSFADYYVTSVSLNSTGRQAVVSGLSALDGVNTASLYVLDFTKDTPVYFSEFENNIIYDVQYLNDRNACAIGRSASYSLNTGNGNVEAYEYEGKALTAYDINTDTDTYTISLSNSGDGRNCEIASFNSGGKKDKSFTVDEKIIDLSSYKGRLGLLTGSDVLLYSKDGKQYSKKTLRSDPHSVVLYTGSDAYVLCTGYIDTVSL